MDGAERLGTATSGLEERQGPEIVRPLAAWMEAWATTNEWRSSRQLLLSENDPLALKVDTSHPVHCRGRRLPARRRGEDRRIGGMEGAAGREERNKKEWDVSARQNGTGREEMKGEGKATSR